MGNAGSANPVEKKGHILQRFITKTLVVLVAVILALLAAEFSVRFLTTIGPRSGTLKPALEDSLNVLTERTSTLTPGYTGILSGRDFSSVSIQVNAYGFRDPVWDFDTLADQRPYLFVGDSHFFGWGVEQEERISEQFAVQLKEAGMAAPVLNMSIPGWGTYQYLDVLEIHAVRVRPRVVILGFFVGNDFLDDITTVASHRNAGTGESTVSLFDTFNDQLRESLRASRVFNLVKYGLWNFQAFRHLFNTLEIHNDRVGLYDPVGGDWQDRLYSPTLEAFRLIAEFSNDAEIPILVLIIPDHLQVIAPGVLADYDFYRPQRILKKHFDAIGLKYLDILADFQTARDRDRLYFREDKHWTREGHALAARLVLPMALQMTGQ